MSARSSRSYGGLIPLLIMGAAVIPVALLSIPVVRGVTRMVEEGARRELGLLSERVATDTERSLHAAASAARALARDSDIQRATSSVFFGARAESQMENLIRENPIVSGLILLPPPERHASDLGVPVARASELQASAPELRKRFAGAGSGATRFAWEGDTLWFASAVEGILGRVSGLLVGRIDRAALEAFARGRAGSGEAGGETVRLFPAGAPEAADRGDAVVKSGATIGLPGAALTLSIEEPRERRFASVRKLGLQLAGAALGIAALLGLAAFFAGRVFASPMRKLGAWVASYGTGEGSQAVPDFGFAELDEIGSLLGSMAARVREQAGRASEEQRLRLQSELNALRDQMQPHFLFNILNNIAVLAESEPARAARMLGRLSDLYRQLLDSSKTALSPVERELGIVRNFLDLQKMRFEERLNYEVEADESTLSMSVPSLLLQTLVENAVKHGIARLRDGGWIRVKVTRAGEGLACVITNPAPATDSSSAGSGTGLVNSRRRLEMLYGPGCGPELSRADGQVRVEFKAPGGRA